MLYTQTGQSRSHASFVPEGSWFLNECLYKPLNGKTGKRMVSKSPRTQTPISKKALFWRMEESTKDDNSPDFKVMPLLSSIKKQSYILPRIWDIKL